MAKCVYIYFPGQNIPVFQGARTMSREVVVSPLQGIVSTLCVSVGDQVAEGDVLCMIEAMKMLTPIESTVNGKVIEVAAEEKKAVARNGILMVIEY
jgi:acetyl-CoA/propionyl-CoA carboxylase, biotin carboxylase, biotin carboxyl carrier protein